MRARWCTLHEAQAQHSVHDLLLMNFALDDEEEQAERELEQLREHAHRP